MNRKIWCLVGLFMGLYALPAGAAEPVNLLLDSGFESSTLVNCGPLKGAACYGQWAAAVGEYGWGIVADSTGNKRLTTCAKSRLPRGLISYRGKRMYQEVSGKSILPGTYTLKFKCQTPQSLLSEGDVYFGVAQRGEGAAYIEMHVEGAVDISPKGYTMLTDWKQVVTGPADITKPGEWRTVELTFNVPTGGKPLLVMLCGMVEDKIFFADDFSLTRKGNDVPVPPEKTTLDPRFLKVFDGTGVVHMADSPAKKTSAPHTVATTPAPAAKPAPVPAPVVTPKPAPVVVKQPAPESATPSVSVSAPVVVRPAVEPVRPPVDNLILKGDFSSSSLALPTAGGDTTAELSGRWIRSSVSPWEVAPYGGNLGPYVRAAASREQSRLLYVASDAKRSTGSYVLRFDYILAEPSDALGVKVFVSDRDITIGTDGGNFQMNGTQKYADLVMLPSSASWDTYSLPVELGNGYNYVYVLFTGSGAGNTGIDNVSLSPKRR